MVPLMAMSMVMPAPRKKQRAVLLQQEADPAEEGRRHRNTPFQGSALPRRKRRGRPRRAER